MRPHGQFEEKGTRYFGLILTWISIWFYHPVLPAGIIIFTLDPYVHPTAGTARCPPVLYDWLNCTGDDKTGPMHKNHRMSMQRDGGDWISEIFIFMSIVNDWKLKSVKLSGNERSQVWESAKSRWVTMRNRKPPGTCTGLVVLAVTGLQPTELLPKRFSWLKAFKIKVDGYFVRRNQ